MLFVIREDSIVKKAIIGIIALLIMPLLATAGGATFWEINKQSDIERGDAKGVSISDNGEMKPAPALSEIAQLGRDAGRCL